MVNRWGCIVQAGWCYGREIVEWPRDGVTCACAGLEYAGRCNLPKLNHGIIMRGLERHRTGRTKTTLEPTVDCHLWTGNQEAGNIGVKVTSAAHLPPMSVHVHVVGMVPAHWKGTTSDGSMH
jgi:hypothetical protein